MDDQTNFGAIHNSTQDVLDDILTTPVVLGDASKGVRIANYLLDLIGYYIFSLLFGLLLGIINAFAHFMDISDLDNSVLRFVLGVLLLYVYYFVFESLTNRTLGKLITGTKVVKKNGDKPSTSVIALRTVCRLIPFDPLSFLGTGSGWHDEFSGTRVVKIEKRTG